MTCELTPKQQEALDFLRRVSPARAAEIEALLAAEPDKAKRDRIPVTVTITGRLEKFDGEWAPGKQPVETIETTETIGG